MDTSTEIDPRVLAAQRLFADDGKTVEVCMTIDLRSIRWRDAVIDIADGVLTIGVLRDDLTAPDAAFAQWAKKLKAIGGRREIVRIEWS